MPRYLRNRTGVKTETFNKHIDEWLESIPDLPKCKGYAGCVGANSNAIYEQINH